MKEKKYISVKALEVNQPIGSFYTCVMSSDEIIRISYSDVRRLSGEKREFEEFMGIQRELSSKRVKDLSAYVNLVDATFPNAILLSISSENVAFDPNKGILKIVDDKSVGKVLDGQHRIAGLESFDKKNGSFDAIVVIFIDMELEDQALVFATINQTQTKVNKSLVADLFEFAQFRSPQKTCHNIVRVLNEIEGSPFKDKIKILGSAIDKEKETITQATFVESLIVYITDNRVKDRDDIKRGKKLELKNKDKLFLRELFAKNKDQVIAKLVYNYFAVISKKWPNAWSDTKSKYILNKSTGFIALMRLFYDICKKLEFANDIIEVERFQEVFIKIKIKEQDLIKTKYLPGTGGQAKLYKDLLQYI